MAKLPSVFKKGGVVTAASASGICDGAAAVIGKNKTKLPKNYSQSIFPRKFS